MTNSDLIISLISHDTLHVGALPMTLSVPLVLAVHEAVL